MDKVIDLDNSERNSPIKSSFTHKSLFQFRKNAVPASKDELTFLRKCMYGIGGMPVQLLTNSISFYINIFLLEVVLMNPYHIPYVSLLGRVWDAITDPLVGILITVTYTRWGNLKPYILLSMPIMCVTYFFLFYNVKISDSVSKVSFYVAMILIFQTGTTLYFIPYGSMCMVLTSDVIVRDQLTAYRIVFEILGMLFGSSLFGFIITIFRPKSKCGDTNFTRSVSEQEKGYMIASGVNVVITVVCVLTTVFGSVEKVFFEEDLKFDFAFYVRILCFKPYMVLMLTFACTAIGMMFVQSNMALYIIHVLKLEEMMPMGILVMMTCSILLIPVAQFMIGKIGKKITYFSGMVTVIPILLSLLILPNDLSKITFFLIMIYTGYPVMISFLLPWSMLPDCIDDFAYLYGIRKDAAFYSLFGFFQKFSLGFSVGMTGIVLGAANYNEKLCKQPPSVEKNLRYLVGIGSTLFFILSMISIYFYPLNETKRIENQNTLKQNIDKIPELEPTNQ